MTAAENWTAVDLDAVEWDAALATGAEWLQQNVTEPLQDRVADWAIEVDWEDVGRRVDDALDAQSWEDLAILRPYAERALAYFDSQETGAALADWLRQRLDYLLVAETYVRTPATRPPVVSTPSVPSPPPSGAPPPVATTNTPSTGVHRVSVQTDLETWRPRVSATPPPAARKLVPRLKAAFRAEGVPPELIWLAEVESTMNPRARSPVGAVGLFQFMPATAQEQGLRTWPLDQRLDPDLSAAAAARYLRQLYRQFNDWSLAFAAYNAGGGRVSRLLKRTGGVDFEDIASALPVETRMYVPRVLAVIACREGVDVRRLTLLRRGTDTSRQAPVVQPRVLNASSRLTPLNAMCMTIGVTIEPVAR